MELDSPFFESGKPTERVSVIVMEEKVHFPLGALVVDKPQEDGVKSIAIDEFPRMSEDAIEEFWIKKVKYVFMLSCV